MFFYIEKRDEGGYLLKATCRANLFVYGRYSVAELILFCNHLNDFESKLLRVIALAKNSMFLTSSPAY